MDDFIGLPNELFLNGAPALPDSVFFGAPQESPAAVFMPIQPPLWPQQLEIPDNQAGANSNSSFYASTSGSYAGGYSGSGMTRQASGEFWASSSSALFPGLTPQKDFFAAQAEGNSNSCGSLDFGNLGLGGAPVLQPPKFNLGPTAPMGALLGEAASKSPVPDDPSSSLVQLHVQTTPPCGQPGPDGRKSDSPPPPLGPDAPRSPVAFPATLKRLQRLMKVKRQRSAACSRCGKGVGPSGLEAHVVSHFPKVVFACASCKRLRSATHAGAAAHAATVHGQRFEEVIVDHRAAYDERLSGLAKELFRIKDVALHQPTKPLRPPAALPTTEPSIRQKVHLEGLERVLGWGEESGSQASPRLRLSQLSPPDSSQHIDWSGKTALIRPAPEATPQPQPKQLLPPVNNCKTPPKIPKIRLRLSTGAAPVILPPKPSPPKPVPQVTGSINAPRPTWEQEELAFSALRRRHSVAEIVARHRRLRELGGSRRRYCERRAARLKWHRRRLLSAAPKKSGKMRRTLRLRLLADLGYPSFRLRQRHLATFLEAVEGWLEQTRWPLPLQCQVCREMDGPLSIPILIAEPNLSKAEISGKLRVLVHHAIRHADSSVAARGRADQHLFLIRLFLHCFRLQS